jgi:hypothetical protein
MLDDPFPLVEEGALAVLTTDVRYGEAPGDG